MQFIDDQDQCVGVPCTRNLLLLLLLLLVVVVAVDAYVKLPRK